ncbi:MAG: hypothetical protein AAGE03_02185 [Pseudomonadota bacterium]
MVRKTAKIALQNGRNVACPDDARAVANLPVGESVLAQRLPRDMSEAEWCIHMFWRCQDGTVPDGGLGAQCKLLTSQI